MMLIELFAPRGALTQDQRRRVGERLLTELTNADEVPPDVLERARALWQVVVHEPETWIVGGGPLEPSEPPRYLVRMSVPQGSLNDETRADRIATITRVLAEVDEDPQRFYHEPHLWVHLIEVPEHNFGAMGQMFRTADIMNMITDTGHGDAPGSDRTADGPAPETAIDPICGMTVKLTDTTLTAEQGGTTYAFCGSGCRDLFIERQQ